MTKFFTNFKKAFTMAEILLSLTIIGVVAAITLPSLTGNINERTWNTQRKALYARMSQAMALMPALNGFGTYSVSGSGSDISITDTAAQAFVTELGNVLKINNVCDNAHLEDCGIVSKFMPMGNGSEINTPKTLYDLNSWFSGIYQADSSFSTKDTKAVAFETQNGESLVAYYNKNCKTEYLNESGLTAGGNGYGFPEATMCANFIYDLNGKKGPNAVGKDIGFITVFNSMDSTVVAPMPSNVQNANANSAVASWNVASQACTSQDPDSRIPNIDELDAMLINKDLINLTSEGYFWSGSVSSAGKAWEVSTVNGVQFAVGKTKSTNMVRCVKR